MFRSKKFQSFFLGSSFQAQFLSPLEGVLNRIMPTNLTPKKMVGRPFKKSTRPSTLKAAFMSRLSSGFADIRPCIASVQEICATKATTMKAWKNIAGRQTRWRSRLREQMEPMELSDQKRVLACHLFWRLLQWCLLDHDQTIFPCHFEAKPTNTLSHLPYQRKYFGIRRARSTLNDTFPSF